MSARFPITYEVELEKHDGDPLVITAGARPRIVSGPPEEFGGTSTWWSPEHLLVSATASCFTATFYSVAERASLRIGSFRCHARGTLSRTTAGFAFTSIELAVEVRVLGDDTARARALLVDAKSRCFVANSLRCPVELVADVTAS